MSMIGIDPEETAEALERDPGHQGAADLIRQMAARIAELEAQSETVSPASARLLDCGLCYEEQGEEVHPHPECPIGRAAVPAVQAPATDQTCDGCGHRLHAANLCPAVTYAEPCVCDEGAPATGQTAPVDRAAVLRDFLWRLEQSAGDAAAEKFLDDNPDLAELHGLPAESAAAAAGAAATPDTEAACTECDHPKAAHIEGEDPVSPGRCADCPESGEEWHDYQPAVGAPQPKEETQP